MTERRCMCMWRTMFGALLLMGLMAMPASAAPGGNPACGAGAGDCCDDAGNGTPGCDDDVCCNIVCDVDPFCCDTSWDGICAGEANDLCELCDGGGGGGNPACTADAGDCCTANGTPGCEDDECCNLICEADAFCCDTAWDQICTDAALDLCAICSAEPACGVAGTGSCFEANGTPFCENGACCNTVCAVDPFCCDTEWDQACANEALDMCEIPGGAVCEEAGDTTMTQNDDLTIVAGTGIACGGGGTTTENWYARSYTMTSDLGITCVGFGLETNTGAVNGHPGDISVYLDTDGGAPQAPGIDLKLLGTSAIEINADSPETMLFGNYDPPICVTAGQVIVVEFHIADGTGISGFWPGANENGQSGPSYIRADACGIATYVDLAGIGFPLTAYVNTVSGFLDCGGGNDCPWDLDGSGSVGTADLLILFAQWGTAGPADFDGSGAVGTADLLIMFANWGDCP